MNRYRYLFKNIGLLTISNFSSKFLVFFLVPLYTNILTTEEYGIGFRKGSDIAAELDAFLDECYADGTMQTIAETYGVQAALIER